ncbi:peptidoglycan-binding protein [Lysobacter fragariae]
MDDEKIERLVSSEGKVRVFEMADGGIVERTDGSVSWRNNNPGNLKFEYANSADATVTTIRTKEQALTAASARYQGVVGLDQWGNAVFESYEAGRAAKIQLLERKFSEKNVVGMLQSYSTADYSGNTNHRAQADFIYAEGDRSGVDLRTKKIGAMTGAELAALADGIKGFEGWNVGTAREVQLATGPHITKLQARLTMLGYTDAHGVELKLDGKFDHPTQEALKEFQRFHGLPVDGIASQRTRKEMSEALSSPLVSERLHSNNDQYIQAHDCLAHLPFGTFRNESDLSNAAATLVLKSRQAGIPQIDYVMMNIRGDGIIVGQGNPRDPASSWVIVDKVQAVSQSVQVSTAEIAKGPYSGQVAQVNVQDQHAEHRMGLRMSVRP